MKQKMQDPRIKNIFGIIFLWGMSGWLWAAGSVDVSLEVSDKKMGPDESVSYRVSISAPQKVGQVDIQFPQAWKAQGVDVLGPEVSQGTQVQIINGVMSSNYQLTYNYQVSFRKPGTYLLKSPRVEVERKVYRLQDVTIEVDPKYAQRFEQRHDPFGFFDRFFKGFDFGSQDVVRPPRAEDLQLVFQPSSTRVLEGEPIWSKLIVYIHRNYRPQNMSPHFDVSPRSLFWMEYLDQKPSELPLVGPGQDVAYQLSEFVLFPLQAGREKVEHVSLELDLVTGVKTYPFTTQAKPVEIEVQPLPSPRPSLPLVSDELSVQFEVEKNQLVVDQPVKFSYIVSGVANLRLIDFLPLEVPSYVDVVTQEDVLGVVRRGGYRFELTKSGYVMARRAGHVTFKTQPITYYHPVRREYQQTPVQTFELEVVQGAPGQPTGGQSGGGAPPGSPAASSGLNPHLPRVAEGELPDSTSGFLKLQRWFPMGWAGLLGLGLLLILVWGVWWTRRAAERIHTHEAKPVVKKEGKC